MFVMTSMLCSPVTFSSSLSFSGICRSTERWFDSPSHAAMSSAADLIDASYKAWLAEVHDVFGLHPDAQQALHAHFVARAQPMDKHPIAVVDSKAWCEHWTDLAEDAGLTQKADVRGFLRWLQATDSAVVAAGENTRASAFMAVMNTHGVTVTPAMRADAEVANANYEAGNEHAQATCHVVRWLVYAGELADGEVLAWFAAQEQSKSQKFKRSGAQ